MFFSVFERLCREKGLSPNAVAKELSLSSGSVSEWKKGRTPQNNTLKRLAEYFGVSTEYLLGKKEPPSVIDEGELNKELIGRLCSLSQEELDRVDAFVQGLLSNRSV